ncbi:MAG: M67 family metallopeptidase [Nitrospira sp.]|nr:M67 family metallopeptidase [Nitrospira sp.]
MNKLFITRELLDEIISHCREDYPKEACGILGGKGNTIKKVYRAVNVDNSSVTYRIEPFQILKSLQQGGLEMIAVYHSHPHSQAYPSLIDIERSSEPYSPYVSIYMIVSLVQGEPEVSVFAIKDRDIREIELIIA